MVIHKQILPSAAGILETTMPEGAKILDIQVQPGSHGAPSMWYLCDPANPHVRRIFHVVDTSEASVIEAGWDYIGTFQSISGTYVWHIFEVK